MIVRFYGGARDLAGMEETRLDVSGTLDEVGLREALSAAFPELGKHLHRMRFAKDDEFTERGASFEDSDVIDVLPPVAGGTSSPRVLLAEIQKEPINPLDVMRAVSYPEAGAVATFTGVVRNHSSDTPLVTQLDYECHPVLGPKELRRVVQRLAIEYPLARFAVAHRIGALEVGDIAVAVAVSAPHRKEAFEACELCIARIKDSVPIWKREWGDEGGGTWTKLAPSNPRSVPPKAAREE